jgi:membrane protease YdiL (CAAX protease family)
MKRDVAFALTAYIFLFLVSFIMSIALGLGKAESVHDPSSLWLYGRRILMVILAISLPWLTRKETLLALGWKVSIKWALISLGIGVCIGLGNKGGFNPTEPIAILLALLHTFATELFFRGYLFRTLAGSCKRIWVAFLLSSAMYGFSYLTVSTTWTLPIGGRILFVMLFTILGMVFAYSYKKSGSFLVPWMMHFFGVLRYRLLL